jgi:hypothetical protein
MREARPRVLDDHQPQQRAGIADVSAPWIRRNASLALSATAFPNLFSTRILAALTSAMANPPRDGHNHRHEGERQAARTCTDLREAALRYQDGG